MRAPDGTEHSLIPEAPLIELVYELLDAHDDTADIASELAADLSWRAHLEYLRALQRRGRETLARACLEDA
jgi:hypothetical protein